MSETMGADEIHQGAVVIDGSAVIEQSDDHFARAAKGGVTAVNHTVTRPNASWDEASRQLSECSEWLLGNADKGRLVRSTSDILECKQAGTEGIIFGPQDSAFLDGRIERVQEIYDRGVRILQLTYQGQNCVGDGCGVEQAGPLTAFGRHVVAAMNQLGILIDLSHVSEATSWDALDRSSRPVVFTHAHADAMTHHPRSKSDDLIRAVADGGGMIGVTAASALGFLTPGVQPTIDDFVRHVHYLVELVGDDHVGIGLDLDETNTEAHHLAWHAKHPSLDVPGVSFRYSQRHVAGLDSATDFPKITNALLESGFDATAVNKILGGNFFRVFGDVWASPSAES
jgi:membrane dipeptidase